MQAGIEAASAQQAPGKKAGQKGKAAIPDVDVSIKVDWVVEHARQVSPLLPGGLPPYTT